MARGKKGVHGILFRALHEMLCSFFPHDMLARTHASTHAPAHSGTRTTRTAHKPLSTLRHEYSTRGGLNEQLFQEFAHLGGLDALKGALQKVHNRIKGA